MRTVFNVVSSCLVPVVIVSLSSAIGGCAADTAMGMGGPDDPVTPSGPVDIAIVSPASGSVFVRDNVGVLGALVALVDLEVSVDAAEGSYARIGFETPKGDVFGNAGADLAYAAELAVDGEAIIVARVYGFDGEVLGSDEITVSVRAPDPASCQEWLDLFQLDWQVGPTLDGVADPVRVTVPINGVSYRYFYNESSRATFTMDCQLARSLARAAPHLRARDVVEVLDIGVYNYRCIGGGTPPDCPNGMSQHAFARAIDIAGVVTGDGDYYSVNDDWVIDAAGEATCDAPTESRKDEYLHDLICGLKADGVWNIVLTPNYNAAHRDHFHVDLTSGSDFIKTRAVDTGPDLH